MGKKSLGQSKFKRNRLYSESSLVRPEDIVTNLIPSKPRVSRAVRILSMDEVDAFLAERARPRRCWRQQTPPPAHRPIRMPDGTAIDVDGLEDRHPPDNDGSKLRRPRFADRDLYFELLWRDVDMLTPGLYQRVQRAAVGFPRWIELGRAVAVLRGRAMRRLRDYAVQWDRELEAAALRDEDITELLNEFTGAGRWGNERRRKCPSPLFRRKTARRVCGFDQWCPYCHIRTAVRIYRALKYTPITISTRSIKVLTADQYKAARRELRDVRRAHWQFRGQPPDLIEWVRWWPLPQARSDLGRVYDQLDIVTLRLGGTPLCAQRGAFVNAFSYPLGWLTVEDPRRVAYILKHTKGQRLFRVSGFFRELLYESRR